MRVSFGYCEEGERLKTRKCGLRYDARYGMKQCRQYEARCYTNVVRVKEQSVWYEARWLG